MGKFKINDRVLVCGGEGRRERATIVRRQKNDPLGPQWHAVRFDDGKAKVMAHEDGLEPAT